MSKLDDAVEAFKEAREAALMNNTLGYPPVDADAKGIQAAVKVLLPEKSDIEHLDRLFLGYDACRLLILKNAEIEE